MTSGPAITGDDRSEPFFTAAASGVLATKRCGDCAHWLGLEARTCSGCGGANLNWENVSGTGELVTWSIVHHPPHPAFTDQVPFAIGYVELAEGPWLNARIVVDVEQLRAGLPLRAAFVRPDEGESYPVFIGGEY